MIVACPECSRPFEIPDDRIAALVQIACPSCAFRMILDFEAANDPSLVEAGMRMASGWRSAADYHAAVQGPARAPVEPVAEPARPRLVPVPSEPAEPKRVIDEPRAVAPTSPAVAARPSIAPSVRAPVEAEAEPTVVRGEPGAPSPVDDERHPEAAVGAVEPETIVESSGVPRPRIEVRLDDSLEDEEGPTQIHTPSLRAEAMPAAPSARPIVETAVAQAPARTGETTIGPAPTAAPTQPRVPAHTPAAFPSVAEEPSGPSLRDSSVRSRPAPRFESIGLEDEDEDLAPRSSLFGTIMVVLLLLSALGLVGASVALEQTPDPRPLLEKLYRQYMR